MGDVHSIPIAPASIGGACAATLTGLAFSVAFPTSVDPVHPKRRRLHVSYSDPLGGFFLRLVSRLMPESVLARLLIRKGAPAVRAKDIHEAADVDPYCITEMEEGRVWQVTYTAMVWDPQAMKMLIDTSNKGQRQVLEMAAADPRDDDEVAQQDFERTVAWSKMSPESYLKGASAKDLQMPIAMHVTKLRNGELLLYCPVVVHSGTFLSSWLRNLGPVKYIVIGSSSHTTYLPEVLRAYPEAVVVGGQTAEAKLLQARALQRKKLDVCAASNEELASLNETLAPLGARVVAIEGDGFTEALMVLAHSTLLEVDLLYKHMPSCGCVGCQAPPKHKKPEHAVQRTFLRLALHPSASPNGWLPVYRFAAMDPLSPFSSFTLCRPADDGSTCKRMADSLRSVLALPFKRVLCVHSPHNVALPADDFKAAMDASWQWLDGQSLLRMA